MPTNYIYESGRQKQRKALRSYYRFVKGRGNINRTVPSEKIRTTLILHDITLTQFAKAMNMSLSASHYLVTGCSRITPETAAKLSYVLGGDAREWLYMQNEHDLSLVKLDKRTLKKL